MVLGIDPGWVLDQPLEDLPMVDAILRRANEKRVQYDESLAEAIAARTAARMVPPLAKHITKLVNALRRAQRI